MAAVDGDAKLAAYGAALADALDSVIAQWVERSVAVRVRGWSGQEPSDDVVDAARRAGTRAHAELGPELRALLARDVDGQRVNPLAILRRGVSYATEVLRAAGVPEVVRDQFDERAFPDDVYDLAPASFADVDPSLAEPGLEWGAAKAHAHLTRRRR